MRTLYIVLVQLLKYIFRGYMLNLYTLKFLYLYGTLNGSLPAADHMTTTFEYQILRRWVRFIEILARNVFLDNADDYGTSDEVRYQIKKLHFKPCSVCHGSEKGRSFEARYVTQ